VPIDTSQARRFLCDGLGLNAALVEPAGSGAWSQCFRFSAAIW